MFTNKQTMKWAGAAMARAFPLTSDYTAPVGAVVVLFADVDVDVDVNVAMDARVSGSRYHDIGNSITTLFLRKLSPESGMVGLLILLLGFFCYCLARCRVVFKKRMTSVRAAKKHRPHSW